MKSLRFKSSEVVTCLATGTSSNFEKHFHYSYQCAIADYLGSFDSESIDISIERTAPFRMSIFQKTFETKTQPLRIRGPLQIIVFISLFRSVTETIDSTAN